MYLLKEEEEEKKIANLVFIERIFLNVLDYFIITEIILKIIMIQTTESYGYKYYIFFLKKLLTIYEKYKNSNPISTK